MPPLPALPRTGTGGRKPMPPPPPARNSGREGSAGVKGRDGSESDARAAAIALAWEDTLEDSMEGHGLTAKASAKKEQGALYLHTLHCFFCYVLVVSGDHTFLTFG